jgi:hypothetical protein
MKIFFNSLFLIILLNTISCSTKNESNEVEKLHAENECPKGHKDSIIPILYGFPSEESFEKADSGLVYLAGCELPVVPKKYYCKIHELEF